MERDLTRRAFLARSGGFAAATFLAACQRKLPDLISPRSSAVRSAEARRLGKTVRAVDLRAAPLEFEIGGRSVKTWGYGSVPGPELRVKAGEILKVNFRNDLPETTSIHWHGIRIRNDMDGVAPMTQREISARSDFVYEFTVPDPGTYFFHPHVGLQLDRGLYAPLIVEDPKEPGAYDQEIVLVLDDWTDGTGPSPEKIFSGLKGGSGGGMPGMDHGGGDSAAPKASKEDLAGPLRGHPGDVDYPHFLVNGRPKGDPQTFETKPGNRIRLRVINAGSDTAFRVALDGHKMQVTHTDGFPVKPEAVDCVVLGMGERFDALVTIEGSGAIPFVALAEGKKAVARALIRSGPGEPPAEDFRPKAFEGRLLMLADLEGADSHSLKPRKPDRTHKVELTQEEGKFVWMINGKTHEDSDPLPIEQGERVRLVFDNPSTMFHPMHLHGHTFQVAGGAKVGPRKDTVIVLPNEKLAVEFDADNPGQWMLHCHNVYHQEAGMMTSLGYLA